VTRAWLGKGYGTPLPLDALWNPLDDDRRNSRRPSHALGVAVGRYGYWGPSPVRNFAHMDGRRRARQPPGIAPGAVVIGVRARIVER
jgi:hypothetical protein